MQSLSFLFNQVQSAGAALRKIFTLLDTESDLPDGRLARPAEGDLELHGVTFGYTPGTAVLDGVDLVVPRGEHLALVGPTGAGKSTLAKLVARFHDPTSGTVTIGGTDLRDVQLAGLRRRVAMITQDGYVFDATVRDNIRVARPEAADAEIEAAVARIGATEALAWLAQGLDAPAGPGGAQLSAGQRQLVALARAALLEADVLVLDEATSDLDPGTELTVTAAMAEVMRGRTVIVIAHRLSTILEADRIAVVADGGIAELGTPRRAGRARWPVRRPPCQLARRCPGQPEARLSSASRASAFGKISAGGVTSPAPTWPVPATRPAMPVLICGQDAGAADPGHVDAGRRAPELQDRDRPARVLAEGDLVHPPGGGQRVGHRAADEPDDRRRGGHREAADAGGLGDRRVADVGVGVVGAVVAEEQPVGQLRRAGEPLVAGAGDLDAEVGAVAGHRDDHRRAGDAAGGVERELAGRHRQVEEEVVVAADEPQRLGDVGGVAAASRPSPGARSRSSISVPARLRLCPSSPICSIWVRMPVTSTGSAARHGRAAAAARARRPSSAAGRAPRARRRRSAAPCRAPR